MHDKGARNLAAAICLQAVVDYKNGLMKQKEHPRGKPSEEFKTAKLFIEDEVFSRLSGINNKKAIIAIRKQVAEEFAEKKKGGEKIGA